jgi:hypothetical protein
MAELEVWDEETTNEKRTESFWQVSVRECFLHTKSRPAKGETRAAMKVRMLRRSISSHSSRKKPGLEHGCGPECAMGQPSNPVPGVSAFEAAWDFAQVLEDEKSNRGRRGQKHSRARLAEVRRSGQW